MNSHVSVDDQLKQIITPGGKSYYQVQLQRARVTAIVLAMAVVISLVFLVFAFVQKAAADTARERAVESESLLVELQGELNRCRSAKP